MTILNRSAMVSYSPEQMYNLINDVESYPKFLPWCTDAEILENSGDEMLATIQLSAAGVHKNFTTRNTLTKNYKIEMEHVDGPFEHLKGAWTFEPLPEGGCKVALNLEFEVHSGLAGMMFGMLYNKVADKLVESFNTRAEQLYGTGEA